MGRSIALYIVRLFNWSLPNSVFQNKGSYTLLKPKFVALLLILFKFLEVPSLGRYYATKRAASGSIPDAVIWIFHSFLAHYGCRVDSAFNGNEYQQYFMEGKGGQCIRLITLQILYAYCLEIWKLLLPGTLKACPGISVPFTVSWSRSQFMTLNCLVPFPYLFVIITKYLCLRYTTVLFDTCNAYSCK